MYNTESDNKLTFPDVRLPEMPIFSKLPDMMSGVPFATHQNLMNAFYKVQRCQEEIKACEIEIVSLLKFQANALVKMHSKLRDIECKGKKSVIFSAILLQERLLVNLCSVNQKITGEEVDFEVLNVEKRFFEGSLTAAVEKMVDYDADLFVEDDDIHHDYVDDEDELVDDGTIIDTS